MIIDTQDAKLFCRAMGKGAPLIVIHGGPGLSQDYLLPHMCKLAENHFVIFYDQRGCGQSIGEINARTINIETFVDDLEVIRKTFNFDKVSILGHSWGGFLAMEYAIAYPDQVSKLILSNCSAPSSEDRSLFIQEILRRTSPFQKELTEIYRSQSFHNGDPTTIERLYRIIFRTYCYLSEAADLLNLHMTQEASINGSKVYKYFSENVFSKNFNLHDALRKLKIPTLVIHGEADPVPFSTARNIHESVNNSRYVLLERCGHFPFVEDPDTYFSCINDFLND
ncbi:MAG: proline iminopeptidase-family hydrolase [Chlamydiae bacterium]|nr:proline iminopeptidase-family hydrolase [Chlamydiota bacterium]